MLGQNVGQINMPVMLLPYFKFRELLFCFFSILFSYDVALFILMYVLPLIILFATYIPITVKLWSDRGLGEVTRAQIDGIKSKRRVRGFKVILLIKLLRKLQ